MIKITDIELMLIHFDNNIVDLKLRKFNDLLNFKDPRSLKYGDPIYNEINLNYQLHKIELISIWFSSINVFIMMIFILILGIS